MNIKMFGIDQWILGLVHTYEGKGIVLYVLLTCLVAGALACIIGLERRLRGKEAGMRTHALLAMGCAFLMTISIWAIRIADGSDGAELNYDISRVAAGVITGIGFLCGGVIIREKFSVRGLTTAATLWICAAIGLACGAGFVIEAILVTIVTFVSLMILNKVIDIIDDHSPSITMRVKRDCEIIAEMREFSERNGLWFKNAKILCREDDEATVKIFFGHSTDEMTLRYVCDQCLKNPQILSAEPNGKAGKKS